MAFFQMSYHSDALRSRSLQDSLSHFDEKLLLLYDLLNTEEARKIALPRHEFLKAFYDQFRREQP